VASVLYGHKAEQESRLLTAKVTALHLGSLGIAGGATDFESVGLLEVCSEVRKEVHFLVHPAAALWFAGKFKGSIRFL